MDSGMWSPIVQALQGILSGCGGIGILIGLLLKASAGSDEGRHAFSHRLIGASATGLLVGLLASDIAARMLSWI